MKRHVTLRTLLFTAAVGTIGLGEAQAQFPASSYGFTPSSGTFTEITGGTAVSDIETDDDISDLLPIGFTFNYCGTDYTEVIASSNGWLSFEYDGTSGAVGYNSTADLNTIKPALMPLWDDLSGAASIASASYVTTGTAPNRVFTIQCINWRWNYASSYDPTISFQVKLHETTNEIQFIYRQEAGPGNAGSSDGATIGIGDALNPISYLVLDNSTTAPTPSSSTFTDDIDIRPATGQVYTFSPPENCATVAGLPTSGTIELGGTELCVGGTLNMSITTNVPMPPTTGITYTWQTSTTTTGPWTTLGTTNGPSYATPAPVTSAYYRCEMFCNGTTSVLVTPSSPEVTIVNPSVTGTTDGARCGPGSVPLSATAGTGSILKWYQAATGGAPLGEGPTFNTPYITETTSFYVGAVAGSAEAEGWVGDGTNTIEYQPNPFYATYMTNKVQMLVKASELTALGLTAGEIHHIGFEMGTVTPDDVIGDTVFNFRIALNTTTAEDLTTTFETGLQEVYTNPAYSVQGNVVNNFELDNPFFWDGASNVIVEVCFANDEWGGSKPIKYTSALGFEASHYQHADNSPDQCTNPTGFSNYTSTDRPNILFQMTTGCQGVREEVVATVNEGPALTFDHDTLVCNDAVTPIAITSNTSDYASYNWTPTDYLFTDAAGTAPYTSGSASTIYFRSTVPETHTVYLMAGDPTVATGCTFADTLSIWVQPGNITLMGMPDTICAGVADPSTTLLLNPGSGYAPNSITWYESADGVTYNLIAGESASSYTTPPLTALHHYRVDITGQDGVCQSIEKTVHIAEPEVISTKDSFNCGPGVVYLEAVGGATSGLVWYDQESGGSAVGSGPNFTTPYLLATDTFYVVGSGGQASSPGEAVVGAGAEEGDFESTSPFYHSYGGYKHQMLITAEELNAAGVFGGPLTSLAFHMVTSGTTFNGFAVSMKPTEATTLNFTWETGLEQVAAPQSLTTTPGWTTIAFDNNFIWDGTSNVIVQTCWSNENFGDYSASNDVYYDVTTSTSVHYGYEDGQSAAEICDEPAWGSTTSNRPQMRFGYFGPCESPREAVIAYIRPMPIVDLGDDINNCVDSGTMYVLDAGVQPNSPVFAWDDGSSSQVRAVGESGTYSVNVTNQWGCSDGDTVNIVLRHNPVVDLGNDTSVCNGVVVSLDAGTNGIEYFWNTGATTQVIEVNNSGQYNVFVTNEAGCVTLDTVNVIMDGELPSVQGIAIDNNGGYTFTFTAINPQNVIGYEWDFGDGSALSYADSATHTYATTGNYFVTVKLSSTCGFYLDSTSTHIVGIDQINVDNNSLTVYPNPANDYATIVSRGGLKLEQVSMYNVLGQLIQTVVSDSTTEHRLSLSGLASGVYTLQVQTDKGIVTRKLEIIK